MDDAVQLELGPRGAGEVDAQIEGSLGVRGVVTEGEADAGGGAVLKDMS